MQAVGIYVCMDWDLEISRWMAWIITVHVEPSQNWFGKSLMSLNDIIITRIYTLLIVLSTNIDEV